MAEPIVEPDTIIATVFVVTVGAIVFPFVPPAFGVLVATWGTVLSLLASYSLGYLFLDTGDTKKEPDNGQVGSFPPTPEEVKEEYVDVDSDMTEDEFEEKLDTAIALEKEQ